MDDRLKQTNLLRKLVKDAKSVFYVVKRTNKKQGKKIIA